ncbi:hypothetical protein [Klenkia brasiliensis]|uniref:Neocarzinostatin family protein n=1 Tax=Klenkia brasiliensis TaxID=333142 RepID=A0A1G7SM62_9ACTN|nr:hypothetical protein [Klenkia brasiliensis]SDG23330.1 hypothetical protein SAMN05660324_2056 [Klenkia brasiliensis]
MRARSRLLLALGPAALAVAAGTASPAQAAPSSGPVGYVVGHHAEAQVLLADGRQASVVVDEYASGGPSGGRWSEVAVVVACESSRDCATGGEAYLDLDGDVLTVTPGLGRTTLPPVQMTLSGWTDRGATQVQTTVTVSAVLTATGPLAATTTRGSDCASPSSTPCRSLTVVTSRPVSAAVTLGGATSNGTGTVSSTRTVSVAAR